MRPFDSVRASRTALFDFSSCCESEELAGDTGLNDLSVANDNSCHSVGCVRFAFVDVEGGEQSIRVKTGVIKKESLPAVFGTAGRLEFTKWN